MAEIQNCLIQTTITCSSHPVPNHIAFTAPPTHQPIIHFLASRYLPIMFALRRAAIKRSTVQSPIARRCFHASATRFVKVGDSIPDVELMESSPGNKVNLATELKGKKGVIVGVPAAYCKFQPLLKR